MVSTLERIFKKRQFLGMRDQGIHQGALLSLAKILESGGVPHPYCAEGWDLIKAEDSLCNKSDPKPRGPLIQIGATPSKPTHAYRVHRLDQVLWKPFLRDNFTIEGIGVKLKEMVKGENLWLPLSEYAEGHIKNHRNFSWWTTHEPFAPWTTTSIAEWVRELGIPSDYIRPNMILLRLESSRANDIALAHVPSSLDGFNSEIFHPQIYATPQRPGSTISLNQLARTLRQGKEEFTLAPIPVAMVYFSPLEDIIAEHGVPLDARLFSLLHSYYEAL